MIYFKRLCAFALACCMLLGSACAAGLTDVLDGYLDLNDDVQYAMSAQIDVLTPYGEETLSMLNAALKHLSIGAVISDDTTTVDVCVDGESAMSMTETAVVGGTELTTPVLPEEKDIAAAVEAAKDATGIVLCTYSAHIRRTQLDLLKALAALGKPMIVCAMGAPYDLSDLPEGVCGLTAFEYTVDMMGILKDVMTGAIKPEGTLSVKL